MGMAVHHSLYLKSFLQEMQLVQLAKPFELSVFTELQWQGFSFEAWIDKEAQACSASICSHEGFACSWSASLSQDSS